MLLHVRQGKGAKDRYVPLPEATLEMLRTFSALHRHPTWLFPGRPGEGESYAAADTPMSSGGVQLAQESRFVGGQIGMVGILQAWTRDLRYHPHVHFLVPGGGLSTDGQRWVRAKNHFFVYGYLPDSCENVQ